MSIRNLCCFAALALSFFALLKRSSFSQSPRPSADMSDADIREILNERLDPKVDIGIVAGLIHAGRARMVWAGKAGPGVVILHNSAASIDDIGFHLINRQFPITKPPAPPKARKEIALKPSLLDAYVGEYQLAPTITMTVTREGEQLFLQVTGQSKLPVYPESETDFFYKIVDAQVTFVKDPGGQVTGLILHQGGRDTPGKKTR